MSNKKPTGWEMYEIIQIGLVNCCKCDKCDKIINYNGLPPQFCPQCNSEIKLYKEIINNYK